MSSSSALEAAPPRAWGADGAPLLGTWRGDLESLSYDDLDPLQRLKREKRWLWCGVFTEDIALALAIVRTGYAANVFVWVFDRRAQVFLEDVTRVLPAPAALVETYPRDGEVARYRALVEGLRVERSQATWTVAGRIADVRLDLEIAEGADPITAICGVEGGVDALNVTRKQAVARASGIVRVGTRRIEVAGDGFIDFSHGILARETIWQWGIGAGTLADGRRAAFNLVAQFNDSLENVVWIAGVPHAAGAVVFHTDAEVWRVVGDDLDLHLEPEGVRSQDLDLGLVVSEYVQPLGRWRGTLCGQAFEGVGVAEFHRSVW